MREDGGLDVTLVRHCGDWKMDIRRKTAIRQRSGEALLGSRNSRLYVFEVTPELPCILVFTRQTNGSALYIFCGFRNAECMFPRHHAPNYYLGFLCLMDVWSSTLHKVRVVGRLLAVPFSINVLATLLSHQCHSLHRLETKFALF